jgi:hypothetical protein
MPNSQILWGNARLVVCCTYSPLRALINREVRLIAILAIVCLNKLRGVCTLKFDRVGVGGRFSSGSE